MEDLTQGRSNDLNFLFLRYANYFLGGHNESVFSLPKRENKACQGILLLLLSTLRKGSGVRKKHSYLSQRAMQCWHVSKCAQTTHV